jgi:hypothetical protein
MPFNIKQPALHTSSLQESMAVLWSGQISISTFQYQHLYETEKLHSTHIALTGFV